MPVWHERTKAWRESGELVVIGITQDPENRDAIAEVLAELDITYPVVLSEGDLEAEVGGIPVIPATMVVDRDGQVTDKRLGLIDEAELRTLVESLL